MGNRQQSRFLALVSNYDRLSDLSEKAANSQDAATLQVLKTMDSIEFKSQQLQTSLQSLYTESGIENFLKGILDIGNNIVQTFTMMPTVMGFPIVAIGNFVTAFMSAANIVTTGLAFLKAKFEIMQTQIQARMNATALQGINTRLILTNQEMEQVAEAWANNAKQYDLMQARMNQSATNGAKTRSGIAQGETALNTQTSGGRVGQFLAKHKMGISTGLSVAGLALSMIGANVGGLGGGLLGVAGSTAQMAGIGLSFGGVWGAAIGAGLGVITGVISNWTKMFPSLADQIKKSQEEAEKANNDYLQKKAKTTNISSSIENLRKLEEARYDSLEAEEAYYEAANKFGEEFPQYISAVDTAGNVTIDLTAAEQALTDSRNSAIEAAKKAAKANYETAKLQEQQAQNNYLNTVMSSETTDSIKTGLLGLLDLNESEQRKTFSEIIDARGGFTEAFGIEEEDVEDIFNRYYDALSGTQNDYDRYIQIYGNLLKEIADPAEGYSEASQRLAEAIIQFFEIDNKEVKRAEEVTRQAAKSGIAQNVGAVIAGQTGVTKEMTSASEILTNKSAIEFEKNGDTTKEAYNRFIDNLSVTLEDDISALQDFWDGLGSTDKQSQLNELIKNKSKYGRDAWNNAVNELVDGITEIPSFIVESLYKDVYDYDKYKEAIDSRNKSRGKVGKEILEGFNIDENIKNLLGADQLTNLLNVYDTIASQLDNEKISSDQANNFIEEYSNILNDIFNAKNISPEIKASASALVAGWEDFSISGFFDLAEQLSGLGIDDTNIISSVQSLYKYISTNLEVELQTFAQKIAKGLDDFKKALDNAEKGMDLDDALAMATKLNVSIDKFSFRDGKYFFSDAKAIQDAYIKYNEDLYDTLDTEYQEQIKGLKVNSQEYIDLTSAYNQAKAALDQYAAYQTNAFLIRNGRFVDFIRNVLGKDVLPKDVKNYIDQIEKGQFDQIPAELQVFASELWDAIEGLEEKVIEDALSIIESGGKKKVTVNAGNRDFLRKFGKTASGEALTESDLVEGATAWLDSASLTLAEIIDYINTQTESTVQGKNDLLKKAYDIQSKNNIGNALEDVINSYQDLGADVVESLGNALGKTMDQLVDERIISRDSSGRFYATLEQLSSLLDTHVDKLTTKQYNELRAALDQQTREATKSYMFQDVLENRTSLVEEDILTLTKIMDATYDEVLAKLTKNADGTYTLGLDEINTIINDGIVGITTALQNLIAEQIDEIISNITGLASNQSSGFDSIADMQQYVSRVRDAGFTSIGGKDINMQALFEWSDSVNAFVLTTEGIISQVMVAKQQLDSYTNKNEQYFAIQRFIEETGRQFAEQIDVSSLISGGTAQERFAAVKAFSEAIESYNAFLQSIGDTANQLNVTSIYNNIKQGGRAAVQTGVALAKLAGKQLTTSDVQTLYRGQVEPYINAINEVNSSIGSIVSAEAAQIMELPISDNIGLTGQYVVSSAANLVTAYANLYAKLVETNEATLAELNNVYAAMLEAQSGNKDIVSDVKQASEGFTKQGDSLMISALQNAASMTYTQLGEIMTQAGYSLEENFGEISKVIKDIGGGKLRIMNFNALAKAIGWDSNSEEYLSAFKAYNDAMIEVNHKIENEITNEIKGISEASIGDRVNLTYLVNKLGTEAITKLNDELNQYGSEIIDGGILDIQKQANLPAVIQTIRDTVEAGGADLAQGVAELSDALDSVFKSFGEAISNGIKGTLTNTEAAKLGTDVKNMLNIDLKFTETTDGLKISTDAAMELYSSLKGVSEIAASLTFDALAESLQQAGEDCENISKTMASIAALKLEVDNSDVKERLSLYQQIARIQMSDPNQYDFMGRSLPDRFKGPSNYWDSLGQMFTAMNEASDKGGLAIEDFYNIVNEMNNLAAISGKITVFGQTLDGSMESAAALIEKGFSTIKNVDGKGVVVTLQGFGIDFEEGANSMGGGVEKGIHAMAQSQIDMLDGMIALLETVVQMEKLGDIQAEGGMELDFEKMFQVKDGDAGLKVFTDDMKAWASNLMTAAETNADLANALDGLIFNGESLRTMLNRGIDGIPEAEAQTYFTAINSLYQMFLSGEYDLENLAQSIADVAAKTGLTGEITIDGGTIAIGYGVSLVKGKDNKYKVGNESYDSAEVALQAYALQQDKDFSKPYQTEGGEIVADYKVSNTTFQVSIDKNGKTTYKFDKESIGETKKEAIKKAFEQETGKDADENGQEFIDWVIKLGINASLIVGEVKITDENKFKTATHDKIVALANALAGDGDVVQAASEIGINVEVTGELTEEQRRQIAELAGIESKVVQMDIAANVTGGNEKIAEILTTGTTTGEISLTPNLTDTSVDATTLKSLIEAQVAFGADNPVMVTIAKLTLNANGATPPTSEEMLALIQATAGLKVDDPVTVYVSNLIANATGASVTGVDMLFNIVRATVGSYPIQNVNAAIQSLILSITDGVKNPEVVETALEAAAKIGQLDAAVAMIIADATGATVDSASIQTLISLVEGEAAKKELAVAFSQIKVTQKGGITGFGPILRQINQIAANQPDLAIEFAKAVVSILGKDTSEVDALVTELGTQNVPQLILTVLEATAELGPDATQDKINEKVREKIGVGKVKDQDIEKVTAWVKDVIADFAAGYKGPNIDKIKNPVIDLPDVDTTQDVNVHYNFNYPDDQYELRNNVFKGLFGGQERYKYVDPQAPEIEYEEIFSEPNFWGGVSQKTRRATKNVLSNDSEIASYLKYVQNIVNHAQTLSQIDLDNLDALSHLGIETENGEAIDQIIDDVLALNEINLQTQQDQLGSIAQAFSGLDATNLIACAQAMSELAESAQIVSNIKWDAVTNGINAINAPQEPSIEANSAINTANIIVRAIEAKVTLTYTDDSAQEIITNSSITREIILTANTVAIQEALNGLTAGININSTGGQSAPISAPQADTSGVNAISGMSGIFNNLNGSLNNVGQGSANANTSIVALSASLNGIPSVDGTINNAANAMTAAAGRASALGNAMYSIPTVGSRVQELANAMNNIPQNKRIEVTATIKVNASGGTVEKQSPDSGSAINLMSTTSAAKGNVALAAGQKSTLMGELGPELVVSNGRYFVVGQDGAEMVDLPSDAIVFNHLQTRRLLSTGKTGRGTPIVNEKSATSFATGNATGPAMASAAAALSALKQIRAMWQSMLGASLKDLGQQAGAGDKGGGGGGGGGGNNKASPIDPGYIADLERWYNLLRQIDRLEKQINYEEQLRSKIQSDLTQNGYAIYKSQKQSLKYLDQEIAKSKELAALQKSYYNARRKDLENTGYGQIFTFNEEGLMQYNDKGTMANGDQGGLAALAKINATNPDGSPVYTAREQYKMLQDWGFGEDLVYDNQGKEIQFKDDEGKPREEGYTEAVQAFWDKLDGWKDELDSLYDSYNEKLSDVLEAEIARNEILQEMIDNQLELEQRVVKAIEDNKQRTIDELQKERDALEESTTQFIDGLTQELDKERQMYQNEQNVEDLTRMERQLAILQRSGGSASQIASLQKQIEAKQQEMYFDAQQQQIDAIKQASDLEIERLDAQIDLMTETLEYQKENGLLWQEVYKVMSGSENEILDFITGNKTEWASKSVLAKSEDMDELRSIIQQWIGRMEDALYGQDPTEDMYHDWNTYQEGAYQRYYHVWTDENVKKAQEAFDKEMAESADPNRAGEAADKIFQELLDQYLLEHPEIEPTSEEEKPTKPTTKPDNVPSENTGGGSGGGSSWKAPVGEDLSRLSSKSVVSTSDWQYDNSKHWKIRTYSDGTTKRIQEGAHNDSNRIDTGSTWTCYCSVCGYYIGIKYKQSVNGTKDSSYKAYSSGGLADYTGLAMVHGSKSHPEAFLNAEDTQTWKNDILSGSKGSLTNQLLQLQAMLDGMTNVNTTAINNNTQNDGVTIDKVEVNMNVSSIANDYDARRAGEQALEEMVKIARRSGMQGIRR